jgi:GntR family transcriptional regulator
MSPNKQRRWEIVYNALRTAIDQGELQPGDHLPAEGKLADDHDVSRHTVRAALNRLRAEGLITGGDPPFTPKVRDYQPLYWHLSRFELGRRRDDPDTGVDEWAADMREQGREPRQQVSVAKLQAPRNVAAYLEIPHGTWLVRRRRLRFADDVPVSIADTWLPDDIANRTIELNGEQIAPFLEERDIAVPQGLVRAVGIVQLLADDQIMSRMPAKEEASLLNISDIGSPVIEHIRVGIDDQGRRVRVLISVSPGHRLCLKYRLHYQHPDEQENP